MRGRTRAAASLHAHPKIPIVDRGLHVIGWTDTVPQILATTISHREAEKIVGGPVTCAYVEVAGDNAIAAGAPHDWRGPWRCLALVDERATPIRTPSSMSAASMR